MNLRLVLPLGRRLLVALLAALAIAAGAISVPVPAAHAVTVFPHLGSSRYESRVQYWINVRRAHHGLRKLRFSGCADRVAERWARHLAATDSLVHQSMYALMDRCNANYSGETLGRGAISPKHLVSLWMHSREHRAVLLSRHARRIGVGASPNGFGEWVVAADFMRF